MITLWGNWVKWKPKFVFFGNQGT